MVMSLSCTYNTGGKDRGLVSHGHVIVLHVQHWTERMSVMVMSLSCTYSTGMEEKGPVSNVIPALLSSVTHLNFVLCTLHEEFCQSFGFHSVYIHCITEW